MAKIRTTAEISKMSDEELSMEFLDAMKTWACEEAKGNWDAANAYHVYARCVRGEQNKRFNERNEVK